MRELEKTFLKLLSQCDFVQAIQGMRRQLTYAKVEVDNITLALSRISLNERFL